MDKIKIAGFAELLTVAFIFLKLLPNTPVNSWSWLWVLSPLWIPIVLVVAIIVVVFLASVAASIITAIIFGIYELIKKLINWLKGN